jgi:outer membrane murein-binding lipoprotein Lpp
LEVASGDSKVEESGQSARHWRASPSGIKPMKPINRIVLSALLVFVTLLGAFAFQSHKLNEIGSDVAMLKKTVTTLDQKFDLLITSVHSEAKNDAT